MQRAGVSNRGLPHEDCRDGPGSGSYGLAAMALADVHNLTGPGLLAARGFLAQIDSHLDVGRLTAQGRFSWQLDTRRLGELSRREQEVFLLLGFGLSNRSISYVLGVTERTVKAHVGHILAKLALESRLQAGLAAFALLMAAPPPIAPTLASSGATAEAGPG